MSDRTTRRGGLNVYSFVLILILLAIVAGLIYGGIRLFGDEQWLRQLDAFEARLLIAWERLQLYISRD